MKKEINNEIDLLMRRLSRRPVVSATDAALHGEHLDADELSLYAENALPMAARARYTEHLAECARCRELVVQLSSSAGVVAAEQTSNAPTSSGLRNFLASLFSPMVLRYSVPALGLIVVAVVGIGLWRQGTTNYSPQMAAESNKQVPASNETAKQSSSETVAQFDDNPALPTEAASSARKSPAESAPVPGPNPTPPAGRGAVANVAQEAPAKKVEEQQPTARTVESLPAHKPAAVVDEAGRKLEAEARKEEPQITVAAGSGIARQRAYSTDKDEGKRSDVTTAERSGPAKSKNEPSDSKVGTKDDVSVARIQRDSGDTDKDDAELHTVAGRRFRKQRGIWVDTAYDSARTTVNVARDSEQYRALVADEPGIKTIADRLNGEVIVVWKGRAYRIR